MRRKYPLLRSISNALFVLLLLYTIAISIFTYVLFYGKSWEEACRSLENDIILADQAMNSFFDEISRVSAHLATNEAVLTEAMFRSPTDSLKNYQATQRMQNVQLSYSYLDYIALYSQNNDRLISTIDMGSQSSQTIKNEVVKRYGENPKANILYLKIDSTEKNTPASAEETLSFIAYSGLSKKDKIGAVVLGVDTDFLQQVYSQNEFSRYAPIFLLGEDGKCISGPQEKFPAEAVQSFVWERVQASGQTSGYFSAKIGEEKTVVCFHQNDSTGTCLVQFVPSRIVSARLPQMLAEAIVVVGLIFCVGVISSYLIAYRLLNPLYSLLSKHNYALSNQKVGAVSEIVFLDREFTRLTRDAERSEMLMYHTALHDLLLGQQLSDHVTEAILDKFFSFPYYQIALISFDQEMIHPDAAKDFSVLRYAVCNIAAELLGTECERLDTVFVNSTDVVIVISRAKKVSPSALKAKLKNLVNIFLKHYQTELLIAVSSVVDGIYDLNSGYLEAVSLMQENFLYQKDIVFAEMDLVRYPIKSFPVQLEESVFSAVSTKKPGQIEKTVTKLFDYISSTNYEYALIYISRFVTDFFRYCEKTMPAVDPVPFQTIISQIYKSKSIYQVQARVVLLCEEMAEGQKIQKAEYSPMVVKAMEITRNNYWREEFSVNTAADLLNISTPYFNRIFKREYGASYGEYLNTMRLQRAKTLLTETELSVSEICAQSGFTNASYFFTLFKKTSGLTPMEFRANWSSKAESIQGGAYPEQL